MTEEQIKEQIKKVMEAEHLFRQQASERKFKAPTEIEGVEIKFEVI